jgi:hypothetical protein
METSKIGVSDGRQFWFQETRGGSGLIFSGSGRAFLGLKNLLNKLGLIGLKYYYINEKAGLWPEPESRTWGLI